MKKFKSDIEIARKCKLKPISKILKKINVPDNPIAFSPMGRHIAKINFDFLDKLKKKKDGHLILVTAITPTPAGEGKTTTSVGLNDGLNKIGQKSDEKCHPSSKSSFFLTLLVRIESGAVLEAS